MDRRFQRHKRQLGRRLYGRTKPGTLLKHQIPNQTERWATTDPGFTEIDLLSHSGACADGECIHSLNLSDIHTTWVETRAVMGKGEVRVQEARQTMRTALPFRLGALTPIMAPNLSTITCIGTVRRAMPFTRGRPYKKDDNAHIEQKNWTHVRKLAGYDRYDSAAPLAALNTRYAELRLFHNLWLPSVKLSTKTRVGSRVRRTYEAPQTPFERVRASPKADARLMADLTQLRQTGDPSSCRPASIGISTGCMRSPRRAGLWKPGARPVEAKSASTRSLEHAQDASSTAPTGPRTRRRTRKRSVTLLMAR